jgi:hypothetical protein
MAAPARRLALSCLVLSCLALRLVLTKAAAPTIEPEAAAAAQRRSLQPTEDVGAALWQIVLDACVRPATVDGMLINGFDYAPLTSTDASPTKTAFEQYIAFLDNLPAGSVTDGTTSTFSPAARKALLINAYNALIVKVIVERFIFHGPAAMRSITVRQPLLIPQNPASSVSSPDLPPRFDGCVDWRPQDIGDVFTKVWKSPAGSIANISVTLDDVEKGGTQSAFEFILFVYCQISADFPVPNVEPGVAGVSPLVGLLPSYGDPRIHASIVCGSVSWYAPTRFNRTTGRNTHTPITCPCSKGTFH